MKILKGGAGSYEENDKVTLKLTVGADVYATMTAAVGSRGVKRKECRLTCKWVNSRLDGREYDFVKLYGGVPGFYEWASWTKFECDGYECVGEDGVDYEVEDYGDGFTLLFEGRVWEIKLGKVVDRHYGPGEICTPEQDVKGGPVDDSLAKILKLLERNPSKQASDPKKQTAAADTKSPSSKGDFGVGQLLESQHARDEKSFLAVYDKVSTGNLSLINAMGSIFKDCMQSQAPPAPVAEEPNTLSLSLADILKLAGAGK